MAEAGAERRILVIIETILRAEAALTGLAKLEAAVGRLGEVLQAAGIDIASEDIARTMYGIGAARQALEGATGSFRGMAEAVPGVTVTVTGAEAAVSDASAAYLGFIKVITRASQVLGVVGGSLQKFGGWLSFVDDKLNLTSRAFGLLTRALRTAGGFFLSVGRSVVRFVNPLTYVSFAVNQITRSFRILTALLLFQFWRNMEDAVMSFVDSLIGANARMETFQMRMAALIGGGDRAESYFNIVRDAAIGAGASLTDLMEATFRFASVSGKNMQVFQELVNRVVTLAFWDPKQGLAGAGVAVMEALTGQFRSLVRRFEIGTLQMARSMREQGFTNIEVLRAMMDSMGLGIEFLEAGANTWQRLVASIRLSWEELAKALGRPVFLLLEEQLIKLRARIQENWAEIQAFAGAVGTVLAGAFRRVIDFASGLMDEISPESWYEWGVELMYSLGSGLLRGMEFVLEVVVSTAQIVADFLMAMSPPKKGPLAGIYRGGQQLIREWIRGMEAADLGAITRIASFAMNALSLLQARGVLAADAVTEYGSAMYSILVQAMHQLRNMGQVSESVLASLQDLFGDLFGDVEKYLGIYEKILDIQVEIEAREAAVAAAEELIEAQEKIIDGDRELLDIAREKVELAKGELKAFQERTRGVPRRFLAQRESELEAMVSAAEAEVDAREERLEAAEEEMENRRENLELQREFLAQSREQQKIISDQLRALEAQMNFMEKLFALERKALKDAEAKREVGIDEGEDIEYRKKLQEEINRLTEQFLALMERRLGPLGERFDALLAAARGFLLYDPEGGVEATLARVAEMLGRELTPAEEEAIRQGVLLRENLGSINTELTTTLGVIFEYAKGLFGIGEGEEDARKKGETFRLSLETLWKETLRPLVESVLSFVKGILGMGEAEKEANPAMFRLGRLWGKIGENLGKILEFITKILASPLVLTLVSWIGTGIILFGWLGKIASVIGTIIGLVAKLFAGVAVGSVGAIAIAIALAAAIILVVDTFGIALIRAKGDWKEAVRIWTETWQELLSRLGETLSKFFGFGQNIISSIVEGIISKWNRLTDLIQDIADLWPFSLAKEGPFSKPIRWDVLVEGLDDQLLAAEKALTSFASFEVGIPSFGATEQLAMGVAGVGLMQIEIVNHWDASITAKDRRELGEMMRLSAYNALSEVVKVASS